MKKHFYKWVNHYIVALWLVVLILDLYQEKWAWAGLSALVVVLNSIIIYLKGKLDV